MERFGFRWKMSRIWRPITGWVAMTSLEQVMQVEQT